MSSITEDLKSVLNEKEIKGDDISEVKKYLEASKLYESLVSSGLATKRGNNLLPPDKTYRFSITVNSSGNH
ncbi:MULTISPECIES: hypothetical protein [Flavobacteriaceae]|uniref:hypothetical protein n=1 Tax=Flavobacteriaceae TaxID=49546 RepID=UPI00234928DD|nr:hypothetical protein [Muricauda sp. SP22]MDC6362192.1 hypothetical protein [Muricauda sp. SP22]